MTKPIPPSAFTIKYKRRARLIITDLEVMEPFDANNIPDHLPPIHKTKALWDTGASNSVITTSTVKALGLIPSGKTNVSHYQGESQANTYVVNFRLPNRVGIAGIVVSESPGIVYPEVGAIIGMDIITQGDFSITNAGGQTWMSYRFPSSAETDYVKEVNRIRFAGVGSNDPCPCGKTDSSGRPIKFKKCHGA